MPGALDNFRLDDQVAVVTGASRGIGASLALALAEAGANVVLVARSDLSAVQEQIVSRGRQALTVSVDVGAEGAAQQIFAATAERFGVARILINNAGMIRRAPFLEFSEKDWQDVVNLNLSAAFRLSQVFAKDWAARKAKGKIINIASLLSYQGGINVSSYTAAKSGLAGLTHAMANELAPLGINVNAIVPGYIQTDNTAPLRANPVRNQAILERIPAGRWGQPDDLNGAAIFLASRAADYVHGTLLAVDGGWLGR